MTDVPPSLPPYEAAPPPAEPRMVQVRMPDRFPWATYAFLGLSILAYLGQSLGSYLFGADLVTALGVKYGPLIAKGQLWRLVTPIFLHGSILHVGFNMYALYVIGPTLERFWGTPRYAALYLLSGIAGNIFSLWMTPAPSLGASTAIFGLLAAEGVLVYRNAFLFPNSRKALSNLVMIAVVNFVIGLSPGIDNWGHLGGFLTGGAFAWFAGPELKPVGLPPVLELVDTRPFRLVWGSAAAIAALLSALTVAWLVLQ